MHRFLPALFAVFLIQPAQAMQTSQGQVTVSPAVTGLDAPWALAFLPQGSMLITERDGALLHRAADGTLNSVAGLPDIAVDGQGGLLDVVAARDFETSREVFLSYATPQGRGAGTALAVAKLSVDATQLTDLRQIFEMTPGSKGGRHFGSRIVEALDGSLFLTIGERGDRPSAQDLARHNGSIIRINRDGTVPGDNPFLGIEGAEPEIWSYGHRNPQGAALDLQGQLWVNEHGARGGDEVNMIRKGANYGWPIISYGRHYSGRKIGEGTQKTGMMQPAHYWDPSIAPSGMLIYSGTLWPEWRGDFFVGSLKFDYISRLDGDDLGEAEQLQSDQTNRVRDIREAPDGSIWFISVGEGTIYRITP